MHPIQKNLIKYGMQAVLAAIAFLAKRNKSGKITAKLAEWVAKNNKVKPATSLQNLGDQWQSAFPSKKQIPITSIDESTVYAEIRTPCPLRGSGDTMACYRMMNFDRVLLDKAGGQFIVLQSQAAEGNTYCKVAMRMKGAQTDDLVQAHEKKT